jgi:hypothetical protein
MEPRTAEAQLAITAGEVEHVREAGRDRDEFLNVHIVRHRRRLDSSGHPRPALCQAARIPSSWPPRRRCRANGPPIGVRGSEVSRGPARPWPAAHRNPGKGQDAVHECRARRRTRGGPPAHTVLLLQHVGVGGDGVPNAIVSGRDESDRALVIHESTTRSAVCSFGTYACGIGRLTGSLGAGTEPDARSKRPRSCRPAC